MDWYSGKFPYYFWISRSSQDKGGTLLAENSLEAVANSGCSMWLERRRMDGKGNRCSPNRDGESR